MLFVLTHHGPYGGHCKGGTLGDYCPGGTLGVIVQGNIVWRVIVLGGVVWEEGCWGEGGLFVLPLFVGNH